MAKRQSKAHKAADEPLTVTPIPGEPDRYFVQSQSRDIEHLVDMAYVESPRDKPRAVCGCEAVQAQGRKTCPHIEAVRDHRKHQNNVLNDVSTLPY